VKTTPNPNATKNRRGELLPPPLPPDMVVVVLGAAEVVVGEDDNVVEGVDVGRGAS
jgi:hypothetical protein